MQEILTLLYERHSFFLKLALEHLAISAVAIVLAILLGGAIGILTAERARSGKFVMPAINFLYTIPSISMLGFLIPFSGIGNTTAIIALTIYALLPMVRGTYTGITNVDSAVIEAARGMGSTDRQILFRVKLPLAMPVILSGIRNLVVMTIALAGIASFIGAGGLGVAIYRGITTNHMAMTVTGSLLIALLALISDLLIGRIEKQISVRNSHSKKPNRAHAKYILIPIAGLLVILLPILAFFSKKSQTIHIATKPMTEQYILGEMLSLMIQEKTDLSVELTQGVGGGTSNIQPAMESGKFDLYPEYTGTGWNMVLKNTDLYSEDEFSVLQQSYEKDFDMTWLGMYGFNNSYALAVRGEIARKYHLKTISDLVPYASELRFGAEYDFYEREDGYDPLCARYGFRFGQMTDLDIGLKYRAFSDNQVDVMPIFTTDGQTSITDLIVLEDDRSFYPSYQCGNIIRNEILERYPELKSLLQQFDGILDDKKMAALNYQVEHDGIEPKTVAENFLKEKGMLDNAKKGAVKGASDGSID